MSQNHTIAAKLAKPARIMIKVKVGSWLKKEMDLAKLEPMKLPNCMQALNKHKTMYKAAGGKDSKRICIITLMSEKAMLMRNKPMRPKR